MRLPFRKPHPSDSSTTASERKALRLWDRALPPLASRPLPERPRPEPAEAATPSQTVPPLNLPAQPLASARVSPDLWIDMDPAAERQGTWSSPRERLLELQVTRVNRPGGWLAVHMGLRHTNLANIDYLGLVVVSSASEAMLTSPCLRSGVGEGFHDHFLPHKVLSQPGLSEHTDLLVPARHTDIPSHAPWRELILFLPVHRTFDWVLHDLRVFAL